MENNYNNSRGKIRVSPREGIKFEPFRTISDARKHVVDTPKSQFERIWDSRIITHHDSKIVKRPTSTNKNVLIQEIVRPEKPVKLHDENYLTKNYPVIEKKDRFALPKPPSRPTERTKLVEKVLEKEIKNRVKKFTKVKSQLHSHKKKIYNLSLGLFAILTFSATGYVSFTTWQTNNNLAQVLSKSVVTPNNKTSAPNDMIIQSTKNDVVNEKVSNVATNKYEVEPDAPKAIYIKKIQVAAKIMPMGLNSDNSLQAPMGDDAGWYTGSSKPGQDGAMLIDGHSSESGTYFGLFGQLIDLKVGDQITIERGDGVEFSYKIVHTEVIPLKDVDMNKTLIPYGDAKQGVNIITCTGEWTADRSTLDHRLIVYAVIA